MPPKIVEALFDSWFNISQLSVELERKLKAAIPNLVLVRRGDLSCVVGIGFLQHKGGFLSLKTLLPTCEEIDESCVTQVETILVRSCCNIDEILPWMKEETIEVLQRGAVEAIVSIQCGNGRRVAAGRSQIIEVMVPDEEVGSGIGEAMPLCRKMLWIATFHHKSVAFKPNHTFVQLPSGRIVSTPCCSRSTELLLCEIGRLMKKSEGIELGPGQLLVRSDQPDTPLLPSDVGAPLPLLLLLRPAAIPLVVPQSTPLADVGSIEEAVQLIIARDFFPPFTVENRTVVCASTYLPCNKSILYLSSAMQKSTVQLVTVLGKPGTGKSTLHNLLHHYAVPSLDDQLRSFPMGHEIGTKRTRGVWLHPVPIQHSSTIFADEKMTNNSKIFLIDTEGLDGDDITNKLEDFALQVSSLLLVSNEKSVVSDSSANHAPHRLLQKQSKMPFRSSVVHRLKDSHTKDEDGDKKTRDNFINASWNQHLKALMKEETSLELFSTCRPCRTSEKSVISPSKLIPGFVQKVLRFMKDTMPRILKTSPHFGASQLGALKSTLDSIFLEKLSHPLSPLLDLYVDLMELTINNVVLHRWDALAGILHDFASIPPKALESYQFSAVNVDDGKLMERLHHHIYLHYYSSIYIAYDAVQKQVLSLVCKTLEPILKELARCHTDAVVRNNYIVHIHLKKMYDTFRQKERSITPRASLQVQEGPPAVKVTWPPAVVDAIDNDTLTAVFQRTLNRARSDQWKKKGAQLSPCPTTQGPFRNRYPNPNLNTNHH